MVTIDLRRVTAYALLALGGLTVGVMMGGDLLAWIERYGYLPGILTGPTWLYYASGLGMWGVAAVLIRRAR